MQYTETPDRLTITVDADEQKELAELKAEDPDHFQSDDALYDFLERLTCNSELDWVNPEQTGDLTDAPMLGIYGEVQTEESGPYGARHVGCWNDEGDTLNKPRFEPILQRWGFMEYQLRSPLDDLLNNGKAVFVASY